MDKISIKNTESKEQSLRLNINKKKAKLTTTFYKYRDKDTRQIILYVPALELTGYGSTYKKAMDMLTAACNDFFVWLTSLPHSQIEKELSKLGWKQKKYQHKEYSQVFVDEDGQLKNFNAVGDEVEKLTLAI